MVTLTNTTITITWTSPSFGPQSYQGYSQCCRLCERTIGPTILDNLSMSPPYTFTGIDPGT